MDKNEITFIGLGIYIGYIIAVTELSDSTTVEFVSILIAFLAIVLTLYTLRVTRKHNRLSVKPAISSWLHISGNSINYIVENKGIGPAKIKSYIFFIDETPATQEELEKDLAKFFKEFGECSLTTSVLYPNSYFAKDEKISAIKITFGTVIDEEILVKFRERYSHKIAYDSLYGEGDVYDSNLFPY